MPGTLMSALITTVRHKAVAPISTDLFFDDAQILEDLNRAIGDLQRAIDETFQNYFLTIDRTNVYQDVNLTQLSGVPTDVLIVRKIRPRDLVTYRGVKYHKVTYDSDDFEGAQTLAPQDAATHSLIYYDVVNEGAPVNAPTVLVAPALSAQLLLELAYVPKLGNRTSGQSNPIPGASDMALIAWGLAHLRGREREDRLPDPGWIKIYETEKINLVTNMAPRDTSSPQYVEGMFDELW